MLTFQFEGGAASSFHFHITQFLLCVCVCACVRYAFSIITIQLPHACTDTNTQHHTRSHTLYACSGGSYNGRMTSLYLVSIWRSVIKTLKLKLVSVWLSTELQLDQYRSISVILSILYKPPSSVTTERNAFGSYNVFF